MFIFGDSRLRGLFGKLNSAKQSTDKQVNEYSNTLEKVTDDVISLEERLEKLHNEIYSKRETAQEVEERLDRAQVRQDSIINLIDEFEGRLEAIVGNNV